VFWGFHEPIRIGQNIFKKNTQRSSCWVMLFVGQLKVVGGIDVFSWMSKIVIG